MFGIQEEKEGGRASMICKIEKHNNSDIVTYIIISLGDMGCCPFFRKHSRILDSSSQHERISDASEPKIPKNSPPLQPIPR